MKEAMNLQVNRIRYIGESSRLSIVPHRRKTGRLRLATNKGIYLVLEDEIVHCKADGNYTHIYLKNCKHIFLSKTLKYLEHLLEPQDFFRTHQSHLVNMQEIELIGSHHLVLKNGTIIPVARSKKAELRKLLV